MQMTSYAARAYRASSGHRSLREQEADVFHRANGALRVARDAKPVQRVRAFLGELGYQGYYTQNDRLHPISNFDEARDQPRSEIDLSGKSELYVNNFLFVPAAQAASFEQACGKLLAGRS